MSPAGFNHINSSAFLKMKSKKLLGGLATLLVIFIAALAMILLQGTKEEVQSSTGKVVTGDVIVHTAYAPINKILAGTKLVDVELGALEFPEDDLPQGAILDVNDIAYKYAKVDLLPDQPIQKSQLVESLDQIKLDVRSGMRDVAVNIASKSNNIKPGSMVDVALRYSEQGSVKSKLVAENVRVLSLLNDESGARSRRRSNSSEILLELSTEQFLEIDVAQGIGTLSLLLRASGDNVASTIDTISQDSFENKEEVKEKEAHCGKMKVGDTYQPISCSTGQVSTK